MSDLKKEDFQLFDNNKPRAISAFMVEQNGAPQGPAAGNAQTASTTSAAPPQRFIVLLFDDLHLSFVDLENAKKAGEKALDGLLEGSNQVAVLSLSGKVASGLTRDRAKLQQAILSLKSQGDYLHINEVCLKIGYLQAWLMEFPQEDAAFRDAARQVIRLRRVIRSAGCRANCAIDCPADCDRHGPGLCGIFLRDRRNCAQDGHSAGAARVDPDLTRF